MTSAIGDLPAVLVVDDEAVQRAWVALALSRAGWRVVEAGDGDEAVEVARAGGLALVLMDVHLPGIDGLAVTAAIRALEGAPGAVPVVAFTATPVADGGAHFRRGGMDGFIVKPSRPRALAEAIECWRPSGTPLPALRLEPLIGAAELRALLGRFRTSLAESLAALDEPDGRRERAHRLAGLSGTLGFEEISASWLALSEGDTSAIEAARRSARAGLVQLARELDPGGEQPTGFKDARGADRAQNSPPGASR